MRTVNEVSKLTGVSVRTLHYYDKIGLLSPTDFSEAGYRLYDDEALDRLSQILLFKELEFPLKEIKNILASENFDKNKALEQHIELLTLKKEHIENLITFAKGIKMTGVKNMGFTAFDTKKLDEYAKQVKEQWGTTKEYKEFEIKTKDLTEADKEQITDGFMQIFKDLNKLIDLEPQSEVVQLQVGKIKAYISEHFYECSNDIFRSLGKVYGGGGEFTQNINKFAGEGTAEFASKAIKIYCEK